MGRKRIFTKPNQWGNSLGIRLTKEMQEHLKIYKDSDICVRFNKNGSLTISRASISDQQIQEIIEALELIDEND